jgi:integrase
MASIIKRADRPLPWVVAWRDPATKEQRRKAFATKRAADGFRDTVSTEVRQGTYIDRKPIPFSVFAADWLARTKPTVSPNTHALHEWAVNKYLIGMVDEKDQSRREPEHAFGAMPVQNITAERIERWQAELLGKKKPGPRSVEICRTVLGTILEDARKKRRIFLNPMQDVRHFDVPKRELEYLRPEELKAFCAKVGEFYGVLFLLMALCGLRIGEALGLQRPDLDLTRGRLQVRRQAVWLRKKDVAAGEPRWRIVEPKSEAGKRVVEIPALLVPFLQAHLGALAEATNPLGLVFPSEDGTPLHPGNVRRRHFAPALTALGKTGIRPHDFRRTFIAMHVEAGTHPKQIQERVGHSDIRLTMDVYGKIAGTMALSREQVARLDAVTARALPALG